MAERPPLGFELESGAQFGRYKIHRLIAQGGMGAVYEAEQDAPQRRVALKVIKPGLTSAEALRRFEHEAEVLGRLQHPGIAQIYDAGQVETSFGSQPFFAMELVEGKELLDYAEGTALDPEKRVELMAKVCDAVHHAHQKGIIHRDLKPSNILVTPNGQPKILDFGVARVTDADVMAVTVQTDPGQLVGTIPYMSPEQVNADPLALDTRSDVYALGVVLYELLTGRLPYDIRRQMIVEAMRMIREDDPAPLSSIDRTFRGDLDNIVQKALEKDKTRRYGSAAEMGDDLSRFLRDEPVVARKPSTMYQLRKFAARNRVLVAGVVAVFVTMAAGLFFSLSEAKRANEAEAENFGLFTSEQEAREDAQRATEEAVKAEERARDELLVAQETRDLFRRILQRAAPEDVDDVGMTVSEAVREVASDLDGAQIDSAKVEASMRLAIGTTFHQLSEYDDAIRHLERARDLFATHSGRDSQDYLDATRSLGMIYGDASRFTESETLLVEALALTEQLHGPDSSAVSGILNSLGLLLQNDSRLEEAEAVRRRRLALVMKIYGEDSAEYGEALHDLAFFFHHGTYDREAAVPLYEQALKLQLEHDGPQSRNTAETQKNYGALLSAQGRPEDAEPHLRASAETRRLLYGELSSDYANALDNLGTTLRRLGRLEEALALAEQSVAIYREVLGVNRDTATAIGSLGEILDKIGETDRALEAWREALAMRIEVFGPESAPVANAYSNLAEIEHGAGRLEAAEANSRKALACWKASLGPDEYQYARNLYDLSQILYDQRRFDESIEVLEESYTKFQPHRPPTSGSMDLVTGSLLAQYAITNRLDEGRRRNSEIAAILREYDPEAGLNRYYECFGALFAAMQGDEPLANIETAKPLYGKIMEWTSFPPDSKAIFSMMMAEAYDQAGEAAERDALIQTAREVWPPIDEIWVER